MNRRARLRLRGISLHDGPLRWKLWPGASEGAESGACCHDSHAGLPIGARMKAVAIDPTATVRRIVDECERVDPGDGGRGSADMVDPGVGARRMVDERERRDPRDLPSGRADTGGESAGVAWSAASEPDHGREWRALRALRTSRARRLAIALGLAHGARLE